MHDIIQPNFSVDIDGYTYLGRGSTVVGGTPRSSRNKDIAYANCGSLMPASFNPFRRLFIEQAQGAVQ
ncbi:hypothetical protein AN477_01555 [Alicyclobacillus ferrooxydans]|uniref:Uncharacterized protein n=1 Tax=Alicyclobacillus ferrooxydans TaxID=471514 RepID=A0A0P9D0P3_9BACL|nr:hypothetical protein AN477_01555 [Alicyclobacillus ferrooxydans]